MKTTVDSLRFRKYPSTTALQCFEAAARLLSFTSSAQELYMTQSAVSKQVAQLEDMLNISLFYRTSQRISLTPAGKRYYLEVFNILSTIESATVSLMSHVDNGETLRLSAHPTFCARWLIPALSGFNDEYPSINLDIREQEGPFFSEDHDIDVAFLYGDGVWTGMESVKLLEEYCIAVCSPDYYNQHIKAVDTEENHKLAGCTLLHLNSRMSAWYYYFKQQELDVECTFVGPRFDTFHSCISAALLGYGVALVPRILVTSEINSGALVQADDYYAKAKSAYYITYPLALGNSHKVRAVITWIFEYMDRVNRN
ncbi:LysR substrate-binding domain-containing protein [Psychrobacter sanguinis]|uniref:LysR substrate-binding domain-containing protein n=1 Tax=Psychrobacter sanguinis TaxID=861445 RepID=UPI00191A618A|nr:LysR substrate-binding domain-containing protein [Psychrobacter sanguinis]MCC3308282.1 LysR family transcriptional regulator [Psychrobacter sanguinis]